MVLNVRPATVIAQAYCVGQYAEGLLHSFSMQPRVGTALLQSGEALTMQLVGKGTGIKLHAETPSSGDMVLMALMGEF